MNKSDYKDVFVFAEQREGVIQSVALELLGKARDLANELGERVVAVLAGSDVRDNARMLIEYGADVVIEAAGNKVTVAQTPFLVRQGGLILLVGMTAEEEITYNFGQIMAKEARIKSQFRFVNTFPIAIAAVESGAIPLEKIVTHEYSFDQIQDAYMACVNDKASIVKALIKID